MNLRFLETFVWVARLNSFRLTAEKLFSTQASISSRIAALEDELGVQLFLRNSKGVTLTVEGQRVLEYAEQMMTTMQGLKLAISNADEPRGLIRVGAMDTVMHTLLSPFVSRVMECYPSVEIELTADTATHLCEQLQKGYLDVIFQTDVVRDDSVRNRQLARMPVQWIVSSTSLYNRQYASLEALTRERIITFSKNSRPHQDLLNLLHLNNIPSARVSCVNSVAAMTRLVKDGFGVGLLPAVLVLDDLEKGAMTVIDGGALPPPMDIVATWRTGVGLELIENVMGLAQDVVNDYARQMAPGMMEISTPAASTAASELA